MSDDVVGDSSRFGGEHDLGSSPRVAKELGHPIGFEGRFVGPQAVGGHVLRMSDILEKGQFLTSGKRSDMLTTALE